MGHVQDRWTRVGWGPYKVILRSPLPAETLGSPTSATIDRNVSIGSSSLLGTRDSPNCTDAWTPPANWVDGEPLSACYPHFLQTAEVGDVLL